MRSPMQQPRLTYPLPEDFVIRSTGSKIPHRGQMPLLAGVLLLFALAPGSLAAQASTGTPPGLSPSLQHVRAALDKYQDPVVAVREGYLSTLGCIAYSAGGHEGMGHEAMGHEMTMAYQAGGMGVHFLNMGNVGPTLDSLKPQVLIYQPVGDRLKLVAAEWFVPTDLAPQGPPTIFGKQLDGPMAGHEPIIPAALHHYDLHVWLWKSNPYGVFSPTNPDLKCPKSPYSFQDGPPKMVKSGRSQ